MATADRYVDSLCSADKELYLSKFFFEDGSKFPDPFEITKDQWVCNPKCWPSMSYFDIIQYFVYGTNLYSLCQTKAYKSLDGYNYAVNGHVQEIKTYTPPGADMASKHVALWAEVLPSQRQGQRAVLYKAFLIIEKETAEIITAHCTCMAGNGKACSHTAAIAFKVEFAVRAGLVKSAPTEELCKWNAASKKKVQPAKLKDIDFTKPSLRQQRKTATTATTSGKKGWKMEPVTVEEIEINVPEAVILTSLKKKPAQPNIISSIEQTGSVDFLQTLASDMTDDIVDLIESQTRQQSNSPLWRVQRIGRITSSTAHKVYHCRELEKLVDFLCSIKDLKNIPAIRYGIDHEETARQEYAEAQSQSHVNFVVRNSGLVLRSDYPYLGASPDGIVCCDCCGRGCLEIKCPFKFRTKLPTNNSIPNFPIYFDQENHLVSLKETHEYFTQVQMHMFMTGTNYCDFYMFSKENSFLVRVVKDDAFVDQLISKCSTIYKNVIVPKLVEKYSK